MSSNFMLCKVKQNNLINGNFSLKFLMKKMKGLNNELEFMSGYVLRLRLKIHQNTGVVSSSYAERREDRTSFSSMRQSDNSELGYSHER